MRTRLVQARFPSCKLGRSIEPGPDGNVVRDQPLCGLRRHAAQVGDEREAERLACGALVRRLREFDEMADAADVDEGLRPRGACSSKETVGDVVCRATSTILSAAPGRGPCERRAPSTAYRARRPAGSP
jgi:hypothetical protein